MSRVTFEALLNVVAPLLNPEEYVDVSPSKKLLFTIWVLAKQESFLATDFWESFAWFPRGYRCN